MFIYIVQTVLLKDYSELSKCEYGVFTDGNILSEFMSL